MKIFSLTLVQLVIVTGFMLSACSSDDAPKNEMKTDGVIPEHQLKTLKRAGEIEGLILDKDMHMQQHLDKVQNN